jgi:FtsH-binding integral membrane protein
VRMDSQHINIFATFVLSLAFLVMVLLRGDKPSHLSKNQRHLVAGSFLIFWLGTLATYLTPPISLQPEWLALETVACIVGAVSALIMFFRKPEPPAYSFTRSLGTTRHVSYGLVFAAGMAMIWWAAANHNDPRRHLWGTILGLVVALGSFFWATWYARNHQRS